MKTTKTWTTLAVVLTAIAGLSLQCSSIVEGRNSGNAPDNTEGTGMMAEATGNGPAPTCTVPAQDFAAWFESGSVSRGGMVKPANSLAVLNDNCDFYKWSWQMFLWNTSPEQGSIVFDNPPFYDLENSKLVQNGSGAKVRGGKVESVGQAGVINGVLMSQKAGITPEGSLVYYAIHVNDVYAYFASGKNSGALTDLKQFPTTQEELDAIVAYARENYHADLPDSKALTLELKSSWVKPAPGTDLGKYITIVADIPRYVRKNDREWTWDGTSMEEGVTLALVGYHVVGSTAGHPEMVWATFEHTDNAPDVDYYYTDASGQVQQKKTFGPDGTPVQKAWMFMDGNTKQNACNQMHMEQGYDNPKDIVATPDNTISPSSTCRTHPWGNAPVENSAKNNTSLLSLNENITGMLASGDVRSNYFLVGATWTRNGVPGVGNQLPDVVGSKVLANSTMETYFQLKNCFDCHAGGNLEGLSHIFGGIEPLPKP